MLVYSDVASFVSDALEALVTYGTPDDPTFPVIDPGPPTPQKMMLGPGLLIFISVGAGAGFTNEQTYDRPTVRITSLGGTNDFAGAEQLALDIDKILTAVGGNATIGSTRVLYITRVGSPSLLSFDASDRYAFSCSYIAEAKV